MCKALMITLVLLISAVCSQAGNASEKNQNSADLTTLQGCLQIRNDQYNLTDGDGMVHQLSGAANKLGHQVGRQIEITGKPGMRTVDTSSAGAGSSAVEQQVFDVKTVKRIADTCK